MPSCPPVLLVGGAMLIGALASGCGAAQSALDEGAAAVRTGAANALSGATNAALAGAVQSTLDGVDVGLTAAPTCRNTMAFDAGAATGQGTATCVATTTAGKAVTATFKGSVSVDGCDGSLTITVAGRAPITDASVDSCRLGSLLGVSEGSQQ